MPAAQQAKMLDDLLKAKLCSSPHQLAPGFTGVLKTKGLIFSSVIKINCYPQLLHYG